MYYKSSIQQAKAFFTVGFINYLNKEQGGFFWSRATNKSFRDSTANWKTFCYDNGLIFICSKKTGEVRQVLADHSIFCPICLLVDGKTSRLSIDNKREFDKMIAKHLSGEIILTGVYDESKVFEIVK